MGRLLLLFLIIGYTYADTNYRLNTTVVPSHYKITLNSYFDTGDDNAFTYDGEVIITLTTTAPTNQIKLHSQELNFTASDVTITPAITFSANPLEFDINYDFVFINFQNELQPSTTYDLRITYRGAIRTDLNGFYINYYNENGVKKWLGATQMESTHARKVFPCFDEPGLKASFEVILDHSENFTTTLSNMKLRTTETLSGGRQRDIFHPTPIMPTYLVAFVISNFNSTSIDDSFGVYTRPEAINQTAFAFEFGRKVVTELSNYFGIDYYSSNENLKLDHVALPDFRAGAMENWGLVTYREALLLYVPEESMPYYKYRVAQILAHETTHMWFGNLVTCHWWSDTWLNEGFANYFQDYISFLIDPELGSGNILVTGSVYSAYDADDIPNSVPISNIDVNSPAEISGHFGVITYQKAGSVIRMMHHLIGDEAFKIGLHSYLNNTKLSSGYPEIMYSSLNAGVAQTNSLASYPNATIEDVMMSWITQAGHPVVTVTVDYENQRATLSQKRFLKKSSYSVSGNPIYKIPITYASKVNDNFANTKPIYILENESGEIALEQNLTEDSWVIFNVQETGLYRVNYDNNTWGVISQALKGEDREKIHHLNRAKIINDIFAFYFADIVNFDRLHQVIEFIKDDDDYSVWVAALKGLKKLESYYENTDVHQSLKKYALELMENIINKLGYEPKANESLETLRNRGEILEFACQLGHETCNIKAVEMFHEMKQNTPVTPGLRSLVYCNGLQAGNGDDYEFLWNRMLSTNLANEARTILEVLGCTSDAEKTKDLLLSVLQEDTKIYTQDITSPLSSILSFSSHIDVVLDNFNCSEWSTKYPSMDNIIGSIASSLNTDADIERFQSLINSTCADPAGAMLAATNSINAVKAEKEWAEAHKSEILNKIGNSGMTSSPSFIMLGLTIIGAIIMKRED